LYYVVPIDPRLNHNYGSPVSRTLKDINKKSAKDMKIGTQTDNRALNSGDHFLFHPTGRSCPATGRLLDFFDIIADDTTYLESSSPPAVSHVRLWHLLTVDYRYRRRE
jgi:hypothetical protein